MTSKGFKYLKSILKLEVNQFLRERCFDPSEWEFEEFCWKIAEYHRPEKTRPVFASLLAEFAMDYGKKMIAGYNEGRC